jgi:Tol biopolymer transport system component
VAHPIDAAVRAELARILSSELFSRSDRLTAFLRFIVEETLDGHGETLKEQVLALEVYGKGGDYNSAVDPIVRVDARRLRDKLREYYASAAADPIVISIRKGSYTPVFEPNAAAVLPLEHQDPGSQPQRDGVEASRRWSPTSIVGAGSVLVVAGVLLVFGVRGWRSVTPPMRILTVTSFPGAESAPSLSPDGNFVAFLWSGPVSTGMADLWVKAVDGDALRQLTDTPLLNETWAAWSPDGQQIAFSRRDGAKSAGIFVVSPLGGAERKVSDAFGTSPAWTPDSRSLLVGDGTPKGTAIFQQDLQTGERRQLTWPSPGFNDRFPAASPDGRTLAFVRLSAVAGQAALFLGPMAGGHAARRTDWSAAIGSVTWTPDSRDVLYTHGDTSGSRAFRLAALGSEQGTPIPGIPIGVYKVSASQARADQTFRLAFGYGQPDLGLRMMDVERTTAAGVMSPATPFDDSTRVDTPGRFSRDGTQVAFTSDRSGDPQVWVANRDGSGLRRVTAFAGELINVGSWSPDGRSIAIDAVVAGNVDIYVLSVDSGGLKRLTSGPARDSQPEWSRDGRWIYYASTASGRSEIWKILTAGGAPVQLTVDGGYEPREASDGRTIYYVDATNPNSFDTIATLKQVPAAGGPELTVFSGVAPGAWDIADAGIIFVTGDPGPPSPHGVADALNIYSVADRRIRRLGELPFTVPRVGIPRVLMSSRDGRWALVSHVDSWERDILVADRVRPSQ